MVRFENVGLRYGMGPEVLRDLTFSIEPQSFQFVEDGMKSKVCTDRLNELLELTSLTNAA